MKDKLFKHNNNNNNNLRLTVRLVEVVALNSIPCWQIISRPPQQTHQEMKRRGRRGGQKVMGVETVSITE